MAVAPTVERELLRSGFDFQLLHHTASSFSLESARVSRVPPARVAKAVLLADKSGYVLAIVPADSTLDFECLRFQVGRELTLASEVEVSLLFHDCAFGAVPPLGAAYGIETWMDERLLEAPDIYFEAGDHELMVRLETQEFLLLLKEANFGRFSRPAITAAPKRSRPAGNPRSVPSQPYRR